MTAHDAKIYFPVIAGALLVLFSPAISWRLLGLAGIAYGLHSAGIW